MRKTILGAAALSLLAGMAAAGNYTVTVTNNLDKELLAPILITNAINDSQIFANGYVTPEAEEQILTGDPGKLVARIGPDAMVGAGSDGPPGVLLAPGKSVSFEIETDATSVRVLAMIAPTMLPDTYVTNVVDLSGGDTVTADLKRYDIGYDEGTRMVMKSGAEMMKDDNMAMSSETSSGGQADDTMAAMPDETMKPRPAAATITFTRKM